jgi:aspartyl-tRNA(Asn)/glutamyl-tRNA(Gln) amidotransferase subunit C
MIDRSELDRIAELARLHLTEEQAARLVADCRSILDYFDSIKGVDLGDTAPQAEPAQAAPLREDRVAPDPLEIPPAQLAPAWRDGFFVLPRLPAMDDVDEPDS